MILRVLPFILILCICCRTESKTVRMQRIAEQNKDVVVLSYFIRDYMRKTRSTQFTLADILKYDSLGRITKNFSSIELANWPSPWRGGYAVYFKFAKERRNDSVTLAPRERIPWKVKTKTEIGRNEAQLARKFDGEIHLYYPERHYHIKEIVVKAPKH